MTPASGNGLVVSGWRRRKVGVRQQRGRLVEMAIMAMYLMVSLERLVKGWKTYVGRRRDDSGPDERRSNVR